MKKLTRILTMGGFGLLAALATAGPASAAPQGGHQENRPAGANRVEWRSGDQVVGFYRTLGSCELAGSFGERAGNWDDHLCSPVRVGVRRGAWALQVASDDNWDRIGFGVPFGAIGHFPGQFRPMWPGAFRPGQFGRPFPGRPGPGRPFPGRPGPIRPGQPGPVVVQPGPVAGQPGPVRPNGPTGPIRPRIAPTTAAPAAGH
ncbi:hypothetical protein [Actinoplanes sp. NPDC026619]|uniref:hypothetical protein n=1 Tax=Actinoplanes sp. NPDC026619 TaxID=3155798 RepID=UPI00340D2936